MVIGYEWGLDRTLSNESGSASMVTCLLNLLGSAKGSNTDLSTDDDVLLSPSGELRKFNRRRDIMVVVMVKCLVKAINFFEICKSFKMIRELSCILARC